MQVVFYVWYLIPPPPSISQWFFCYTWRAIFRPFFVILVKFSKVLLYLHLVILRPFLIFLLYLFGYTWPLVKIFVIPGFVIPLNKYNKKIHIKDGLLTFLEYNVYLYLKIFVIPVLVILEIFSKFLVCLRLLYSLCKV